MIHTTCLVCESKKLKPLNGYYDKHQLVVCNDCNLVFMERVPSKEELETYYSNYSYASEFYLSPVTIKSYNLLLDEFEKYRKTNKILDVGCGRGWFLIEAKKRGWETYGVEFSDTAIKICREQGINVKAGVLNSADFESSSFDVITSFEVLEHINNPNEEIAMIRELLRKDGLFYCTTPNFNALIRFYLKSGYNIISYPEHLIYYTKKTLNTLLKRHNFKSVKFLSTGISITRFNLSVNSSSTEVFMGESSSDELLRKRIESKWYLRVIKKIINKIHTLTNTGLSLKGYYIKS